MPVTRTRYFRSLQCFLRKIVAYIRLKDTPVVTSGVINYTKFSIVKFSYPLDFS